jgi:hypothetical protein
VTHTPASDLIPPPHVLGISQYIPLVPIKEMTPFTPRQKVCASGLRVVCAHFGQGGKVFKLEYGLWLEEVIEPVECLVEQREDRGSL